MAGDWIKVQHATPDKPEVAMIAERLGIDPDAVTGKLVRLWIWADQQTVDGNAASVTKTLLERVTFCPGICDALESVGWLEIEDGNIRLPHFDRHNGESAKQRALGAQRAARSRRNRDESNADGVTKTLPEKRREEKIRGYLPKGKCTREDWLEYAATLAGWPQEDAAAAFDHYLANGWKTRQGPVKDWKACARNCAKRHKDYEKKKNGQFRNAADRNDGQVSVSELALDPDECGQGKF